MKFPIPTHIGPIDPHPTRAQLAWQQREFAIFVHFGVNTFTNREWGDGTEDPSIFNPTALDADQWALAAKQAGAGHMVLTAKHHDGFCLWPSRFTEHSVKNSPWKSGRGDVVREFCDACRRHGIKPGLYLSPWDRHENTYGVSTVYNRFYLNQLRELLTEYGELAEIWFDGACGEGPSGKRQAYDWPAIFKMCKELQPNAVVFGDGGSDVRWIGNERGFAGDPNWSMVDPNLIRFPGDAGADRAMDARAKSLEISAQLQHGNSDGSIWRPGECDVSIRPGWFYHESEDQIVRSIENLVELYFNSVGRNAFLLLNIPPSPNGLFHEIDVARLIGFRKHLNKLFSKDLSANASSRQSGTKIELLFKSPVEINILKLREPIELGQRIKRYRVHYQSVDNQWNWLLDGDTIGQIKLDRFPTITAKALRIDYGTDHSAAFISEISLFHG